MNAVYHKEHCSTRICADPYKLQNYLANFPNGNELTFVAEPQCLTIKYEPQGGELDAEAEVDILQSSETRTEMKLSADQLYHYELDERFAATGIRVAFMQKEFRAVLQAARPPLCRSSTSCAPPCTCLCTSHPPQPSLHLPLHLPLHRLCILRILRHRQAGRMHPLCACTPLATSARRVSWSGTSTTASPY